MSDFYCPACGRSFPWKPQLAGRRAKCTCGHALTVPAAEPATHEANAPLVAAVVPTDVSCPGCHGALAPEAVLCVNCGYDLRTGRKVATEFASPPSTAAADPSSPAPAAAPSAAPATRRSVVSAYPISHRPSQEEPASSNKMYIILGALLLLVAMAVGGWIIFRSSGGGDANRPRLADDARVEEMIDSDYPKDLTEWVEANPARMLGGMNARQAAAMEVKLKSLGATKVLAFGNGVLCLCVAIELPDDAAKRKALFDWYDRDVRPGDPRTKDLGQRYILYRTGM